MCVPNTSTLPGMQARHPPASLPHRNNSSPVAGCSFALRVHLNEMSQDTSEEGHQGLPSRAPAHVKRGLAEIAYVPTPPPNWHQYAARRLHCGTVLPSVARSDPLMGRSGTVDLARQRLAAQRGGAGASRGVETTSVTGSTKLPETGSSLPLPKTIREHRLRTSLPKCLAAAQKKTAAQKDISPT